MGCMYTFVFIWKQIGDAEWGWGKGGGWLLCVLGVEGCVRYRCTPFLGCVLHSVVWSVVLLLAA